MLNHTARSVSSTEIGLAEYDRTRCVLNDVGEADALVSSTQSVPTGMLHVSVATDFGSMHLFPVLGDFLAQFPDVSVNLELDNRYIEMISEDYDATLLIRIRTG